MKRNPLPSLLTLALLLSTASAVSPADTLVIQHASDLTTLDPAQAYDPVSYSVIENLYEPLVTFAGPNLRTPQPALATRWIISNGGKTYTFDLRKGVKFHSGNTFGCADAAYTLRRQLVTNNADSGNWFFAEALLGSSSNASDDTSVTWSKISNAITCSPTGQLVLRLPASDPTLLSKLAAQNSSIVDRAWAIKLGEWDGTETTWKSWVGKDLTNSQLSQRPSGTGAYKLVRRSANTVLSTAFANYWGPKPRLKNVLIQNVPEETARVLALQRGDADLIEVTERGALPALRRDPNVTVLDGLSGIHVPVLFFNQRITPGLTGNLRADFFADINVRRAINYLMDDARYTRDVTLGSAEPRSMALPTGFLGYNPSTPQYGFSAEKAAVAFRAAFSGELWTNGFTLPLFYAAGSDHDQTVLEMLKANIERLNPKFRVTVQAKPYSELLTDAKGGKVAMGLASWGPDYADPDNVMYTLYASDGYYNPRTGFSDSQIDTWLKAARVSVDPAERKVLYGKVASRAHELAPYVIMPAEPNYITFRRGLKGLTKATFSPLLGGNVYWKQLSK